MRSAFEKCASTCEITVFFNAERYILAKISVYLDYRLSSEVLLFLDVNGLFPDF